MKLVCVIVVVIAAMFCLASWPSVGVVYATESKMVLRIILPDSNAELYEQPLRKGESILIVPVLPFGDTWRCGKIPNVHACERVVEDTTGVKPLNPRHAVVDATGRVVAITLIEPTLDGPEVYPGMRFVQSDDVQVGMRLP